MNKNNDTPKELHLFIIWNKGRNKQEEILQDLSQNLTIKNVVEISWTKDLIAKNYSRFYGFKIDRMRAKIRECGTDPFLLITVIDNNPNYEYVETSRGHELVNKNIFKLKQRYRNWTNGGHKIHSTNSVEEVDHDLTLLIGQNSSDYMVNHPSSWDGSVPSIAQDLVGTNGWQSLEQLFYVLNNTTEYFVMRNHEILPQEFKSDEHGDIDIQVNNFDDVRIIMNADLVYKKPNRVHCKTTIKGQTVLWDIRYTSDNYYCESWQRYLMKNRVLNDQSIYVLNNDDYYYTLIYHAVVHKKYIANDYYTKLADLRKKISLKINGSNFSDANNDFDIYIQHLTQYMKSQGYTYTKPIDNSVYFNNKLLLIDAHASHLKEEFGIKDVSPIMLSYKSPTGFCYYKGDFNGKPVFIKCGKNDQAIKNEFQYADRLYQKNSKNFIKPIFYKSEKYNGFIVFDYKKGDTLEKKINNNSLSDNQKNIIISNMHIIAQNLADANCCHRDVRPENILISNEGEAILFDFQFAVNIKKYKENKYIRRKPRIIYNLGGAYAKGTLIWNDTYSILKIIKKLNLKKSSDTNKHINKIKKLEPKTTVKYKKRALTIMRIKIERLLIALIPIKSLRRAARDIS